MNSSTMKQTLGTWIVSAAMCGGIVSSTVAQEVTHDESKSQEAVIDIYSYSSPFESCFVNGYDMANVNADDAYETAKCFASLLDRLDSESLGASKHTIVSYATNWFGAAADKGHEMARGGLKSSLVALNVLEQRQSQGIQLLASERVFQELDADSDGLLSVAEVSVSEQMKGAFSASDIDGDGLLSFGEYSISSGEATAAGH